jgi:hypothetical protein
MDLGPWQDDILTRLEQGMNARVFAEGIPMNSPAPIDPTGLIKPFIVLWFGSLLTRNLLTEDLCGSQNSVREAVFIVQSFAGNGRALLAVENQARILLAGHRPAGQGQLFEAGSASVRDPSSVGLGIDIRFSKQSMWHGMVNAGTSVEEPLMAFTAANRPCCPKGHLYTEENTITEKRVRRDGTQSQARRCRECVNFKRARLRNRLQEEEPTKL